MDISENDLYWLAGILEGEGSFIKPSEHHRTAVRISINMVDEDVIVRVASLLGCGYNSRPGQQEGWQEQFYVNLVSSRGADIMRQLQPLMGLRRRAQIQQALDAIPTHYDYPCRECGAEIVRDPTKRGQPPSMCSTECRKAWNRKRQKAWADRNPEKMRERRKRAWQQTKARRKAQK